MGSGLRRLILAASLAGCLGGCQEPPLAPETESPAIGGRAAAGPKTNDLQSNALSDSQIDLFWLDNSTNETGWEVHRSSTPEGTFTRVATTAGNVTNYSNTGLSIGTQYCYKVRSFRTAGAKANYAAFSTVSCNTTLGPPPAPSSANVTPAPFGRVVIAWSPASFTATGFRLERAASSAGPWVLLAELKGAGWGSYEDFGRVAEEEVCYRLIAFNAYGSSPPSTTDCTTPPAAPTELAARSVTAQAIDLAWKDNSSAEDGYEVQRAEDGTFLVWVSIASLPENTARYRDMGLPTDKRFWYRLRSTKDGGYSAFTPEVSAITTGSPPTAPTGTVASPGNSNSASVYWIAGSGSLADSFRVERSIGGGSWVPAGYAQATAFGDIGLDSEVQVCYQVFAVNRLGESQASNQDCTTPPAAPSNLRTIVVDDQTSEVRWEDNSGVEGGYILWLYYYQEPYYDPLYYQIDLPANTTSYQLPASTFVEVLAAYSDGGLSDWVYPSSGDALAGLQGHTARTPSHRVPPCRSSAPAPTTCLPSLIPGGKNR